MATPGSYFEEYQLLMSKFDILIDEVKDLKMSTTSIKNIQYEFNENYQYYYSSGYPLSFIKSLINTAKMNINYIRNHIDKLYV